MPHQGFADAWRITPSLPKHIFQEEVNKDAAFPTTSPPTVEDQPAHFYAPFCGNRPTQKSMKKANNLRPQLERLTGSFWPLCG
eukprot:12732335-Prorocentrum_lima.AAC.1